MGLKSSKTIVEMENLGGGESAVHVDVRRRVDFAECMLRKHLPRRMELLVDEMVCGEDPRWRTKAALGFWRPGNKIFPIRSLLLVVKVMKSTM